MNEFTKDDLELIAECVEADFNQTNWPRCMYEPLKNKIQCMINNYCLNNPHIYEFSRGPGYCENCGIHENEAYRLERNNNDE